MFVKNDAVCCQAELNARVKSVGFGYYILKIPANQRFAACEADITEWYVVEAEVRPDTLDDVRGCLTHMKKLGRA